MVFIYALYLRDPKASSYEFYPYLPVGYLIFSNWQGTVIFSTFYTMDKKLNGSCVSQGSFDIYLWNNNYTHFFI